MSVRVLIVDDHRLFAEALRAILESESGIEVVGLATTGTEAVRGTAELGPDVVLMDISMPDVDGLEATRRIRALGGAAARIPVIGVSGRSSTEEEARAHAAGMSGYLAKPISPSKLNTYLSALAAP